MKEIKKKTFSNGTVYLLETDDGYPVEVTDTFLPYYTKDAIGRKQNKLDNYESISSVKDYCSKCGTLDYLSENSRICKNCS